MSSRDGGDGTEPRKSITSLGELSCGGEDSAVEGEDSDVEGENWDIEGEDSDVEGRNRCGGEEQIWRGGTDVEGRTQMWRGRTQMWRERIKEWNGSGC